jgi:type I restriction enzyme R subunit
MQSRGPQKNLSFFAFTATPKFRTLEVFGRKREDGKPYPFHLYSMRQAIEEKFILDVLKNYTTYKTFYRLVKAIPDDPEVDKARAANCSPLHFPPYNIAQKTQVIIKPFGAVMHGSVERRRRWSSPPPGFTPSGTRAPSTRTSRRRATRTSAS